MRTLRSLLALALLLLSLPVACSGGSDDGSAAAKALDRYEVRGVVKDVGGEGGDARATISHEAIPGFKDRKGNESDMKAMTMAFGIDPAVDRKVLTQGAKVGLVIEVDWDKRPSLMIKKATALPADTELSL